MNVNASNLYNNSMPKLFLPTTQDKIEYIKQVLLAVHINSKRVKNSREKRKQLIQISKSGVNPTGPKIDWIKKTAKNMLNLIENHTEAFNITYGDDIITPEDVMDLFVYINELLKKMNT